MNLRLVYVGVLRQTVALTVIHLPPGRTGRQGRRQHCRDPLPTSLSHSHMRLQPVLSVGVSGRERWRGREGTDTLFVHSMLIAWTFTRENVGYNLANKLPIM